MMTVKTFFSRFFSLPLCVFSVCDVTVLECIEKGRRVIDGVIFLWEVLSLLVLFRVKWLLCDFYVSWHHNKNQGNDIAHTHTDSFGAKRSHKKFVCGGGGNGTI